VDHSDCACNKEQLYALVDAEAGILIYSLFKKKPSKSLQIDLPTLALEHFHQQYMEPPGGALPRAFKSPHITILPRT
jgi:hypothetical protein